MWQRCADLCHRRADVYLAEVLSSLSQDLSKDGGTLSWHGHSPVRHPGLAKRWDMLTCVNRMPRIIPTRVGHTEGSWVAPRSP